MHRPPTRLYLTTAEDRPGCGPPTQWSTTARLPPSPPWGPSGRWDAEIDRAAAAPRVRGVRRAAARQVAGALSSPRVGASSRHTFSMVSRQVESWLSLLFAWTTPRRLLKRRSSQLPLKPPKDCPRFQRQSDEPVRGSQIARRFNLPLVPTLLKAHLGEVIRIANTPLQCARNLLLYWFAVR